MDSQRLLEIFDKNGSFAIVVGQNYAVDEMGAALSLYLALTSRGKEVSVISTKAPLVEVSNLVGIDRVKQNFESKTGDLIVSFPYQTDEIGKVSYTLEGGFLNIIVKPKDNTLSFGEKDVIFRRVGEVPPALIVVGVKRLSDLTPIFSIESLKDTTIINIDKPGNNEGFGDAVIIGQNASSVSEQVTNVLLSLGYPMDSDIAQNLMSGIVSATGNFQSPRTSSLAFEMAGILLRNGARRESPRGQAPRMQQFVGPRISQQGIQANRNQPQQAPTPIREFPREQTHSASVRQAQDKSSGQAKDEAPPDWLAPKIFKGSTNVE